MFGAQSEYRPLRRVLMHTPRESIGLVNEKNYGRYLFATPVFRRRFIEEHEQLVRLLESEGVDVLLVEELLRDNHEASIRIRHQPNLTYIRDTITIANSGYIKMKMTSKVRGPEPEISEQAARKLQIPCMLQVSGEGRLEGGDLVYLDDETLLIGVGARSNLHGVIQLAKSALGMCLSQIVAVPLSPWNIHLDGAFMTIDGDLALGHPESLAKPATLFEKGRRARRLRLLPWLGKRGIEFIKIDSFERFMKGTNAICLAPRKCIVYKWNDEVARSLKKHGAEVLEIEGTELLRGGGGPHCITAPILRT